VLSCGELKCNSGGEAGGGGDDKSGCSEN